MVGAVDVSSAKRESGAGSAVDPRDVVRRFYEDLVNRRDFTAASEIVAAGCAWLPDLPLGPTGAVQYIRRLEAQFPDLRVTVDEIVVDRRVERGRVAARALWSGTYRGLSPAPVATSPGAVWPEAAFFQVTEGKIAELWVDGGVTTVCAVHLELWTGLYVNGDLAAQGHQLDEAAWLQLLARAGATCVSEVLPGGVSGGQLPPTEDELRRRLAERQSTLAAVDSAEQQLREAERQLARAQRALRDAKERANLPA
jgi:hypothetical protein